MSQSETINELAAALSKAQSEMQAAIKDTKGVHNSYYADLGSVWDAARPVLSKNGLCVMQTMDLIAEKGQTVLVTTLAHSSGQWMKSHLLLNPTKNDCQGVGSAITYYRRYSLSAILGIVCDEDDDGETAIGRGKKQAEQAPPQETQQQTQNEIGPVERVGKAEIIALTNLIHNLDEVSNKSFLDWIKKNYNANSLQDIPKVCFEKCMVSLNNKIKYLKDQEKTTAVA